MTIKILFILSAAYIAIFTGCATVEHSIGSQVGCREEEIQIVERDSSLGLAPTKFTAQCKGRRYICSARPGVTGGLESMNCVYAGDAKTYRTVDPTAEDLQNNKSQSFDEFVNELNEKKSSKKP